MISGVSSDGWLGRISPVKRSLGRREYDRAQRLQLPGQIYFELLRRSVRQESCAMKPD
jgi:hypothetical protein